MPRSGDDEFSTELPLLCSDVEQSLLEARNGIFLAEYVSLLAEDWASGRQLRLTPVVVRECNRIAMQGIYASAGEYRQRFVAPGRYVPPPRAQVPQLVEEMCDYANRLIDRAVHASAYLLWRINWIHPFHDGNGRVARELSYLALLVGSGIEEVAGTPTIPELIDRDRLQYERYLEDADREWTIRLEPGVEKLESLISGLLVEQAESAMKLDE